MRAMKNMKLLKIYLGEADVCKGKPMAEHIVKMCYDHGIKGATVCKGTLGYGEKRHIHRSDFFSLSGDLPVIVEIVDEDDKIQRLIEDIRKLPFDGLIVIIDVKAEHIRFKEE